MCLAISALILLAMFALGGGRTIPFYVACFFALFAFGPVVNFALGSPIYSGIRVPYIGRASVGFTVALAALAVAQVLVSVRHAKAAPDVRVSAATEKRYVLYGPVLLGMACYGLVQAVSLAPYFLAGSKAVSLQASGRAHYVYLLIELALVSTFFVARRHPAERILWTCNAAAYVAYCIVTFERDFLFVLFVLFLHHEILVLRHRRRSIRLLIAGAGIVVFATFLVAQRGGGPVDPAGVLNQGSLLFVDTFVLILVPGALSYSFGLTYLQSLVSLAPAWLHESQYQSLSSWLVSLYAPGSSSGYGFSLTAEAYLNFGYLGIFVVFVAIGLIQGELARRFARSDWASYISVYFSVVLLYSIRGDSQQLLKSLAYGALLFLLLTVVARTNRVPACSSLDCPPDRAMTAAGEHIRRRDGVDGHG